MEITTDLITHLSKLSKLEFIKEETEVFKNEFSNILKHIDNIQKIDTKNIEIKSEILNAETELREDELLQSIERGELDKIAPEFERGSFVVPLVVEE